MSIIVLGTVALDTVKTPFGIRKYILGGSAVHFAMGARLFTEVDLAAIIGRDFPQKHINFLRQKGIVLDSLIRSQGQSFKWEGEYTGDLGAAHTKKTELGVLLDFWPEITPLERRIKYVFLANVDPDIQMHLLKQMRSPKLVGLDSMNYWIENKKSALLRVLKKANIYLVNEHEARSLSGEHNLIKAAKYLSCLGPKMVLIKKGEHGAFLYSDEFIFVLPAYPTDKVIDPTGAGDTFAGGFMGYLTKIDKINPANIKKAIAYGTVAASFNVEGFGVERTSRLKLKDLDRRLREFKKYILF